MSGKPVGKFVLSKFVLLNSAFIFAPINKLKPSTMKKFFAIVFIAGALTACNNSASTTESTDSTKTDSSTMMTTPPADSGMNKMGDSSMNKMSDSSATKKDSAAKK